MSRHHRAQKWSTHSPKLRAALTPLLPLPCIQCGRPIMPGTTWQVGHRQDAALGGRPTKENTGPIHQSCNNKSGGRLGARITNSKRQASKDIREW